MGPLGAARSTPNTQATAGGTGIQNQLGNPELTEEDADTLTIGMVMDLAENWTSRSTTTRSRSRG